VIYYRSLFDELLQSGIPTERKEVA